jgi:hypothetical protein
MLAGQRRARPGASKYSAARTPGRTDLTSACSAAAASMPGTPASTVKVGGSAGHSRSRAAVMTPRVPSLPASSWVRS